MKSLPILLLTLRLSVLSGAAACTLFIVAAWRSQNVLFDGRATALHIALTYAVTLGALLLMSRVRKMDVAKVVIGAFSLVEMALWCLNARPNIPDGSFSAWIAGLCGVMVAILPFYVEDARRTQRQQRRIGDTIERARAHNTSHQS